MDYTERNINIYKFKDKINKFFNIKNYYIKAPI